MAETEKTTFLADSSGSDGSLSKDLSQRAEMNFSAPIVALPMDDDSSDFQKSPGELKIAEEDPMKESPREEKEPLSPKYDLEVPEVIETHMDSDIDALMLCEHCQGPITKMKKYGKSGKQFCSKQCALSQSKTEPVSNEDGTYSGVVSKEDKEMKSPSEIVPEMETAVVSSSTEVQVEDVRGNETAAIGPVDWNDYQRGLFKVAAPWSCFGKLSRPVKGLKPGMKLESLDKNNPCNYCVATVIDVVGHRVRIRYDGFGNDDSQDFWCNFQAEELFPIGWCAENSYPLQPPNGISSTLEDWKIFLTKTLTGALAAPMDLFRENENRLQPKVHRFHLGMKVEVIHPKKPSIIALATITKSLGPYLYQVTTEHISNLPPHTFYGQGDSAGIFSCGWAEKFGIDVPLPVYVGSSDSVKEQYFAMCKMKSAPPVTGNDVKRAKNTFKIGQKLEAVDQEDPSVIRVASVVFSYGRIVLISFDGTDKVQYIPCDSEDIFPIGWSMKTRHPLSTPYGIVYPSKMDQLFEPEFALDDSGSRSVTLPSFQTVLGKAGIKEELNKKIKAKAEHGPILNPGETSSQNTREGIEKKPEDSEKSPDEGHCVYFNKTCVIGPYMDPDKVASMPDCTANGRPPAAVRFALELIIESSIDAVETMDAIQAGFCPKMFSKGKGKVLKKGLFRFDTKLRASRFLKRLCKKLRSCEYFLSFDPPKNPCPLDCKTSGTTSLESFVAMNGMKPKDDSHSGLLESQKIKRGRPRKEDYEMKLEHAGSKGEFRPGNDGMMQNSTSSSGAQVRVLNPTSYNGRPLVPIAPGAKELVTIMPVSSNVHHGRPPPPYEMGGPTTFVRPVHANTVITSATQPRMVAPVNLRMLSPSTPTSVVAADISSPTIGSQNLATLVMVSKSHGTNQPGQGLFSIRGNVSNQGLRMPLSQGSRKFLGITGTRSKYPGTIKMHGPMYDQAPGTMNPMSHGSENRQPQGASNVDSVLKPFLKMTQVHIPGQGKPSPSRDSSMANDFPIYRDAMHVEKLTYDQARYIKMKQPGEIKSEPQDQHHHFQGGAASSPNQRLSPTIHIHLPSSSNFHRVSPNEPQSSSSGHLRDGIPMHMGDHDLESASRSSSTLTSPIKNNIPVKYDVASHHGIKRHRHQHISSGIKNHLQVATSNPGGSQSSLSPLHSPPPLRPRPSGQQRSIALRSPPNLTPSTVISHFDFTPVTTTTSVMSQGLHVVHHQPKNTQITSKSFNDGGNISNGQNFSRDAARQMGNVLSSSQGGPPGNATVTLTYIPVKSQATDKIVYVPVNQNTISDRHHPQQQQPVLLYSKQRKQHFPGHMMDNGQQIITQRPIDLNVPMSPLEETGHQPFSGITRKFTVRTLHRDSNSGTLPAGLTTVRIQGSNLKEMSSTGSNEIQGGAFYSPKGQNSENIPQSTSNNVLSARSVNMRKPGEIIQGNESLGDQFRRNNENQNSQDSPFHPENFDYEDLSDDDEDCDLDYEELSGDEHAEHENNQISDEKAKRRGAYGFRGKRRKRFLTSRKGGIGSHQYKLKYKRALEQAKFMRERRPSFGVQQVQTKNEDVSASRDDAQHIDRDALENRNNDEQHYIDNVRPKDDTEANDDRIYQNISSNNDRKVDLEKTDLKALGEETSNAVSNGSQMQVEEKTFKRKRKGNSTLEGDFVFGQWALDGTVKKKRKIANPNTNPTRYLNDPLEKVKLPGDPEAWSEEDVASFINATECSKYADTLKQQEIDGSALLLLTRESLMEFTGMKLGPALKICGYVATLKGRLRMQQNMALIQS